ncbi:MAG TPA: beta-galactosidase, partial [Armatimonadota bacterium]|nr:beta-galactosidase [Armatimonadota bacterium]
GTGAALDETVRVSAQDAWGREAASADVHLQVPAGQSATVPVSLDLPRGFFRVRTSLGEASADLRLALVAELRERIADKPGRFGINHAAPSDLRMNLWQEGGMSWVRDWSYKWEQVQPTPGAPFDFSLQDPQIDRVLGRGMHVLLCLPESSTTWCTTAPAELIAQGERQVRAVRKYPPADYDAYRRYVAAVVEHVRDRVQWFEVMNEPNGQAVPPEAYVKILGAAFEAARGADPQARIIGGQGAGPSSAFGWYQGILQLGAVGQMDAINLHIYPGDTPPRGYEDALRRLNQEMAACGGVRPIWVTEWLYQADDDADPTVAEWPPAGRVSDELTAARLNLQLYVICMANGVERFFQHTSHWPTRLNRATLMFDAFFEYRAAPRKAFAAHNAMVDLLGSNPSFAARLELGEEGYGAAFGTDAGGSAVVVWRERGADPVTVDLSALPEGCVAHDLMGVALPRSFYELGADPIYIVTQSLPPDRLAREVQRLL